LAIGDYFGLVPTDFRENLEFRLKLREACARSERARKVIWEACKSDPLFFFQAMCFLVEPRPRFDVEGKPLPTVVPFLLWPHQVPAITTIYENLGLKDVAVYKSRGEGFTWIACLISLHEWLFRDMAKIGLVSSTELKADDPSNLDSLGARIDWELKRLPTWMAGVKDVDWKRSLSDHAWVNLRNGSQINAFAATAETGRAGRYRFFVADELAFWQAGVDKKFMESIRASTESRIAISTPNGASGAFYDMVFRPSNCVRVRVHWTQNSFRNRGLYKLIDGLPEAVDPKRNPIPPEYIGPSEAVLDLFSRLRSKGFRLEGRLRSPWYDRESDRGDATPQSIAQEYDLDFSGSEYLVFAPEFFDKARDTVRRPVLRGRLEYHPETLVAEFSDRGDVGECKIWVQLDGQGHPPQSTYVAAADISSGSGGSYSSNSVCQVFDRVTGEQVLEYASNSIEPSEFAEACVAIARWFHGAYLGWEMNFGGGFTNRVMAIGYANIYMRTVHWRKSKKKQKEVGWHTDDKTKELMFSELHRTVKLGEIVLRSDDLVRECGEYVRLGTKGIVHKASVNTEDMSSRGKAHGDRVIAAAIAVQLMADRPLLDKTKSVDVQHGPPPNNTMAWRVEQWERQDKPLSEWDDDTLDDTRGAFSGVFLD
jgi:hypothetical protein